MARVTVEGCTKHIPNRFELSLIAGHRAKRLMAGAPQIMENKKNEKYTVIALREIEDNLLDLSAIREEISKETQQTKEPSQEFPMETSKEEKKSTAQSFNLEEQIDEVSEEENLMFADDNVKVED